MVEDQPEALGRGRDPPKIGRMHGSMTVRLGQRREYPNAAGVVKGQQPHARRASSPPGDVCKGAAEPAITVIQNDKRLLRQRGQADMLRNSGVTSASIAL